MPLASHGGDSFKAKKSRWFCIQIVEYVEWTLQDDPAVPKVYQSCTCSTCTSPSAPLHNTFGGECSDPGQWDWMEVLKLSTIFCAANLKLFLLREDTIKWNRKRSEKTHIYPGALYKLSTRGWSNQHVVLLPLHSTGTR